MKDVDPLDHGIFDDGEWLSWDEIDRQIRYKEWGAKYPNADRALVPYFEDLLSLAESYHLETGRHLNVYGDLGELFGAITFGIKLNRLYAQGADGRLGRDHVEIKTITPFKSRDEVVVRMAGNFSKLLVVKLTGDFMISGRMIDRHLLPKTGATHLRVRWSDLPAIAP